MSQDDLSLVKQTLFDRKFSPDEMSKVMAITAPLFDDGASFRLSPASEVSSDSVAHALHTMLADDGPFDWRIVTTSNNDFLPLRHDFMTDEAFAVYRSAGMECYQQAMLASCERNLVMMLGDCLRKQNRTILAPTTGRSLPPIIEWSRYNAVGACSNGVIPAKPEDIRYTLLSTYLGFALNGDIAWTKRLERVADLAARKVIPYGLRRQERGVKPTFLCFGA